MRNRQSRSGFTLVELLVVISIIGMLMALLFPAVQAARETGRQNTCRNNMRNLALATVQYEKKTNVYPGFVHELYPPNNPAGSALFTRRSWIFMLLPHLERSDLYEFNLTAGTMPSLASGLTPPELDIVKCPTNPNTGKNTWASCSFVCNTGLKDCAFATRQPSSGTAYPGDWSANGVFHDYRTYQKTSDIGGMMGKSPAPITRMTEGYISTGDGTSNTIMLIENADAVSWYLVMDGATTTDESGLTIPFERQVGCNWSDNAAGGTAGTLPSTTVASPISGTVALQINSQIDGDPTYVTPAWARPAALHPNIVNVAFCDGHVRTLSQDVTYLVYSLLMAPRNRSYLPVASNDSSAVASSVFRTTVLNEGDIH